MFCCCRPRVRNAVEHVPLAPTPVLPVAAAVATAVAEAVAEEPVAEEPVAEAVTEEPVAEAATESAAESVAESAAELTLWPDLPFEEIAQIKKNLLSLIGQLDLIYSTNGNILIEVQNMLQTPDPPPDPTTAPWTNLFETALGVMSIVAEPVMGPTAQIAAVILGGAVENVTYDPKIQVYTNINLAQDFGLMSERLTQTYTAMRLWLEVLADDPNRFRNYVFTIPAANYPPLNGKSYKLRELAHYDIPTADKPFSGECLMNENRSFRYSVAKQEFIKKKYWWVYFVQDLAYKDSQFGNAFFPTGTYNPAPRHCSAPGPDGWRPNLRTRHMNNDDLGKGVRICATTEIHNHHPEYVEVGSYAPNDASTQDDYINNFKAACSDFVTRFPAAHVGPYTIDKENNKIDYHRWYIMEGYNQIQDGSQSGPIYHEEHDPSHGDANFTLADGDFLSKWLFIDDGMGNTLNANGVGHRDDIIRNWTVNGWQIPPTTAGF